MARHNATFTRCVVVFAALIYLVLPSGTSAREHRSREVTREFQREGPCPSTGKTRGACPGFRKDHVVPLACGGPDAVLNLQWQTVADAIAKDYRERKA
jgi:hypothetical protein